MRDTAGLANLLWEQRIGGSIPLTSSSKERTCGFVGLRRLVEVAADSGHRSSENGEGVDREAQVI